MRLKKIKISNFRCFNEPVVLDLEPNKNQIENSINSGYFKKNGDHITPNFVSIIGRNSIGKSNFLEAFKFSRDISSEQELKNIISNIIFGSPRMIHSNVEQIKYEETTINRHYKEYIKKISHEESKMDNKTFSIIKNNYKTFVEQNYYENSNNNDEEIKFEYIWVINNKEVKEEIIVFKDKVIKNSELNHKTRNDFLVSVNFDKRLSFNQNYENDLIKLFGEERLIEIIKIADESVGTIDFSNINGKSRISKIITSDGNKILFSNLSLGTQRFIFLFFLIHDAKKRNVNLLFIDEFTSYMHNELSFFLVKIINKINKKYNLQLITTTHNPHFIDFLDVKQSFLMNNFENKVEIKKLSSIGIRENNSFTKKYLKGVLVTHPSKFYSDKLLSKDY